MPHHPVPGVRIALAAVVLLMPLLAAPSYAEAGPEASLLVPESPSGDVVVTAVADPATAPFVQVALNSGAAPIETHPWATIAPEPVANQGAAVELTAPSWGLSGTVIFSLRACAGADPTSCSTVLAQETRSVQQTAPASAELVLPEEPVFVPEEEIAVSSRNEGGGVIAAWFRGPTEATSTPLEVVDGTGRLTSYPSGWQSQTLLVGRCSALNLHRANCEPWLVSRRAGVVNGADVVLRFETPSRVLTTDPALPGSSQRLAVHSTTAPHRTTWSLVDAAGETVHGPHEGPLSTQPYDMVRLEPGQLPDGNYTARFEVTVTKGELSRTGVAEEPITVQADPPVEMPELLAAERLMRVDGPRSVWPSFTVASIPGSSSGPGKLVIRDDRGRWQQEVDVPNPCRGGCGPGEVWDVDLADLDVGLYGAFHTAELVMPDPWGRRFVRPLGRIDLQGLEQVYRKRTVDAGAALVSRRGDRRVYEIRIPGVRDPQEVGLTAGVRIVDGPPRGTIRTRVHPLERGWSRRRSLGQGAGWRIVDAGDWRRLGADDPHPGGDRLRIEVSGPARWSEVSKVRVALYADVWRTSLRRD